MRFSIDAQLPPALARWVAGQGRGFEAYWAEGLFAKRFGHDIFDVLVLTQSAPRLRNLQKAALHEVDEERHGYYIFATFDVLGPRRFADDIRLDLDEDYVNMRSGVIAGEGAEDEIVAAE